MESEIIAPKMFVLGVQLRREIGCILKKTVVKTSCKKIITKAVKKKDWHVFTLRSHYLVILVILEIILFN